MPFPLQIDIMTLILKGMLIGIIVSAPMGPVGILCIQRTLNKGRWYRFVTGCGAAVSDIIYALITNPTRNIHQSGKNGKGTLVYNGVTGFLVTFSNLLIIFLFMSTFAQFAFVVPNHPVEMSLGYLSIVGGALLWWYGLTWLIDMVREKFDESVILIINKIIGSVVIIFSLAMLIGTVFNISLM